MRASIFSTLAAFWAELIAGAGSIWKSCATVVPYLLGSRELCKEVTEQYPDPISSKTADDLPPRSRGLLFNDIEKCIGCKECEKNCPSRCINIETEPGSDSTKVWGAVFDIDFARCTFCGVCVEVCVPQSLIHTRQFEGAVYVPADMVGHFGRGYVTREQREKWAALRRLNEDERTV